MCFFCSQCAFISVQSSIKSLKGKLIKGEGDKNEGPHYGHPK